MKDYPLELTGKLLDFFWIVGGSNTLQQVPEGIVGYVAAFLAIFGYSGDGIAMNFIYPYRHTSIIRVSKASIAA